MLVQLHGTCLGFEALAIIVSRDADILSTYDSYDDASPLILTEDGQSGSAFFGSLPGDLLQAVQEKPLAMENHKRGEQLHLLIMHHHIPPCREIILALTPQGASGVLQGCVVECGQGQCGIHLNLGRKEGESPMPHPQRTVPYLSRNWAG